MRAHSEPLKKVDVERDLASAPMVVHGDPSPMTPGASPHPTMPEPPRCPVPTCPFHRKPPRAFFQRRGAFLVGCRRRRIRRYSCKACGKSFSDQTFRADRYDKKPHLNARVMERMAEGVGYREGAYAVGLCRRSYTEKVRKIARNATLLDQNLQVHARRRSVADGRARHLEIQFGEVSTFETSPTSQPVTVPLVVEARSQFIIASGVAALPPRGSASPPAISGNRTPSATSAGIRPDESESELRRVLTAVRRLTPPAVSVSFRTAAKDVYVRVLAAVFGDRAYTHTVPRGRTGDVARRLPTTLRRVGEITRDHLSLLRRSSWLHAKRREHLQPRLDFHRACKNYTRGRYRRDKESPGEILGVTPRQMRLRELYGWRQDWGQRSPCPLGNGRRSLLDLSWKGVLKGPRVRVSS